MPESDFERFLGKPVPAVSAGQLKRMWSFLSSLPPHETGTVGISVHTLSDVCEPGADVMAVWFRAALVYAVLSQGSLDSWREGDTLRDKVFETAAGFPIPDPRKVDFDAFVAAME